MVFHRRTGQEDETPDRVSEGGQHIRRRSTEAIRRLESATKRWSDLLASG